MEEIFKKIYRENYWGDANSLSGPGSNLLQTKILVQKLPKFFSDMSILTVLDIPCGDFNWMKNINMNSIEYIGSDIVTELIEKNKKLYEKKGLTFQKLDIIKDELPQVDLIFCRDCLVHFSFKDIISTIQNIYRSNSKYLLTTTFPEIKKNYDIPTGQWRALNLELEPFLLPKPLKLINEECTEWSGKYNDKSIALWYIDDLKDI